MAINNKFHRVILGSFLIIVMNLFFIVTGELFGVVEGQPDFLSEEQLEPLKKYEIALKANEEKHIGYMSKLNDKYTDALDVAKARMVKIGAIRAIKALDSEITRINANDTRRSKDIEAAPDYVRKMRSQYDQFVFRVNNLKRSRDGESLYATDRSLAELQLELTKSDQLEKALKLRQYREEFKRPPKPKEVSQENEKVDNKEEINPPENPEPIDVPFDPPEPELFSRNEYQLNGGRAEKEIVVFGEAAEVPPNVPLDAEKCRKLLGHHLKNQEMFAILEKLKLKKINEKDNISEWEIPSFRSDLTRPADLHEEIARAYGIDNIPSRQAGWFSKSSEADHFFDFIEAKANELSSIGFYEARTIKLTSELKIVDCVCTDNCNAIAIKNPLSDDLTHMRPGLIIYICFSFHDLAKFHISQNFSSSKKLLTRLTTNIPYTKCRVSKIS